MGLHSIQDKLDSIRSGVLFKKTDKQLCFYDALSKMYTERFKNAQPQCLVRFNSYKNRTTKLNFDQVQLIREKYVKGSYGKKRLSKEYGVSTTLILKIVKGLSWNSKSNNYSHE